MHKILIPGFLIITTLLQSQIVNSDVNRRLLFSIGKDERPVFNESSVALSPIGASITILTSDEAGKIYVYENGKKRGPFRDIAGTGVKKAEDNPEEFDPVFRRESDTDYQKYATYDKDDQVTLKFQGKSYGPFQFILEFYFSNDRSTFSAIVMKDGKPQVINSSGTTFNLDGQPGYNYISPGGKKMMVTTIKEKEDSGNVSVKTTVGINDQHPAGYSKENPERKLSGLPEAFIYFQDGKRFGPYDPRKINANNPAFSKTGGDNWLMTLDSKLYINGKVAGSLSSDRISPANIWLTADGKRYAIIVYNKIEFSDGKVYKDPLKIRITSDKDKITVWWLSFENYKDIILCSRVI